MIADRTPRERMIPRPPEPGVRLPIAGSRIDLRPFELSDAPAADRICGEERVMRWVGTGATADREQSEAMIAELTRGRQLEAPFIAATT